MIGRALRFFAYLAAALAVFPFVFVFAEIVLLGVFVWALFSIPLAAWEDAKK